MMTNRNFTPYNYIFGQENVPFVLDSDYDGIRILKAGRQGYIIQAYDNNQSRLVAIKKMKQFNDARSALLVYREFSISRHVHHRNLVELLDAFSPKTGPEMAEIYIVYELMDYSMRDLFNMPPNDNLNLTKMVWDKTNGDYFLADVLFQLFCGLRYLHHPSLAVIHRDLKPENILFRRNNNRWLVKLCDWGLSRYLNEQETMDQTVYVVSYPYRAPEIIITGSYGFSADLWSIGCILGEMIKGQLLFFRKTQNELIYRILYFVGFPDGTVFPNHMTNDLQKENYGPCRLPQLFPDHGLPNWDNNRMSKDFIRWLIGKLMNYTPTERITANDAAHLKQFNFLASYQGMDDIPETIYVPIGEFVQGEAARTSSSVWKERITTALKEFQNER